MPRPRSISGLLLRLAALQLRRRPWLYAGTCAALLTAATLTRSADELQTRTTPIQAAVLPDGFAVMHGPSRARRVLEVDPAGVQRRDVSLELAADARLVGTGRGTAVGWQDGHQLRLAQLGADGRLGDASTWGTAVQRLCDGAATNATLFGIAWLEADGRVWLVHGPATPRAAAAEVTGLTPSLTADLTVTARTTWCGVASAEHRIGLLWNEHERTILNFCDKKGCGIPSRLRLAPGHTIVGVGCLRDTCLIGARDPQGASHLHLVDQRGKLKWSRPLAASSDAAVAIVGVGDRSFAVATHDRDGATIQRFSRDGVATPLAHHPGAATPSLAWSAGKLAVAYDHGGKLVTEILAAPR